MGVHFTGANIDELVSEVDLNHSGSVEFDEFVRVTPPGLSQRNHTDLFSAMTGKQTAHVQAQEGRVQQLEEAAAGHAAKPADVCARVRLLLFNVPFAQVSFSVRRRGSLVCTRPRPILSSSGSRPRSLHVGTSSGRSPWWRPAQPSCSSRCSEGHRPHSGGSRRQLALRSGQVPQGRACSIVAPPASSPCRRRPCWALHAD